MKSPFFFSTLMEAKLADYRAKKKAEKEAEDKKNKAWEWLRFGSRKDTEDSEALEPRPWTNLDYAIALIKSLIVLTGQILAIHVGFGAVYFATSCFAFIWLNLGTRRRREGEMSAYSVFNPNCQSIQGTLTAEQFEAEIRHRRR